MKRSNRKSARRGSDEVRARATALRASLRDALAMKKRRMRELVSVIRAERVALRERLQIVRRERLQEIHAWERGERAKAREEWRRRRHEARRAAEDEVSLRRAELAAERVHIETVERIEHEARERAEHHGKQGDEHVRALVPSELVPLFERVKGSIRGTERESRAEAFLRLAATRPEHVFKLVEPSLERMIETTLRELAEAKRATANLAGLPRVKAANGNALTAGGPDPKESERLRSRAERSKHQVKGEGLDTTQIAKRIREDIAEAAKRRALPRAKYSVRTAKYSMGSSITVTASKLPFRVLNPDAFKVEPGASWITFDRANYRSRFTREAADVERRLEAIVDAYHWDRSDSMTDYYNERFAKHVELVEDAEEWKRIEAAKVAAARADEGRK